VTGRTRTPLLLNSPHPRLEHKSMMPNRQSVHIIPFQLTSNTKHKKFARLSPRRSSWVLNSSHSHCSEPADNPLRSPSMFAKSRVSLPSRSSTESVPVSKLHPSLNLILEGFESPNSRGNEGAVRPKYLFALVCRREGILLAVEGLVGT
jgi:hypothetical protein